MILENGQAQFINDLKKVIYLYKIGKQTGNEVLFLLNMVKTYGGLDFLSNENSKLVVNLLKDGSTLHSDLKALYWFVDSCFKINNENLKHGSIIRFISNL